jgi:phytoene/squalene synthetase
MQAVYFDLLQRIEARGYDVFTAVVKVSKTRQAYLAARTYLR